MTTSSPVLGAQLAALDAMTSRLVGPEGDEIRACVHRLVAIAGAAEVAVTVAPADDAALKARAGAELEHLVAAIVRLTGLAGSGTEAGTEAGNEAGNDALRGIDVASVLDQMRAFAAYLRAPTGETRAKIRQLAAGLPGSGVAPRSPREAWIESLAMDAARSRGLAGDELYEVVERAARALALPVRELELAAQQDAARAQTAARLAPLLDAVIASGSAVGPALAEQRSEIAHAFLRVDLAHVATGLRALSAWLATSAPDPVAHVARLRDQLAAALGPPTLFEPAAGDADRRFRLERAVAAAIDRAVRERAAARRSGAR
jgi:hypothetical protein